MCRSRRRSNNSIGSRNKSRNNISITNIRSRSMNDIRTRRRSRNNISRAISEVGVEALLVVVIVGTKIVDLVEQYQL